MIILQEYNEHDSDAKVYYIHIGNHTDMTDFIIDFFFNNFLLSIDMYYKSYYYEYEI